MRQSRDIIQLKGRDVPFGVRAIESGIEIEGVWISRPSSPVQSIRSPTFASLPSKHLPLADGTPEPRGPGVSDSSRLSVPKAVHGHSNSKLSPPGPTYVRSDFHDASPAPVKPWLRRPVLPVMPLGSHPPTRAPSHRLATSGELPYDYVPAANVEGREGSPQALAGRYELDRASGRSSWSSYGSNADAIRLDRQDCSMLISPFDDNDLSDVDLDSGPALPDADLASLYSHRLSHVAEVGQLRPRARHNSGNGRINPPPRYCMLKVLQIIVNLPRLAFKIIHSSHPTAALVLVLCLLGSRLLP